MSQYIVYDGHQTKYVYGWDKMLASFYFQKHDLTKEEDDQIVVWLGDAKTTMYEVEDLVHAARNHKLRIGYDMRVKLHSDKDNGR